MERYFPPFRLDLDSEQLWRDDQPVALRPKTFAVLRSLVEHPGQLVTKDALLDAVWAGTVVSDTVLKSCIRELRVALDDDAQTPCFIATVHRRGYRFIGEGASSPQEEAKQKAKGTKQKGKIEGSRPVSSLTRRGARNGTLTTPQLVGPGSQRIGEREERDYARSQHVGRYLRLVYRRV